MEKFKFNNGDEVAMLNDVYISAGRFVQQSDAVKPCLLAEIEIVEYTVEACSLWADGTHRYHLSFPNHSNMKDVEESRLCLACEAKQKLVNHIFTKAAEAVQFYQNRGEEVPFEAKIEWRMRDWDSETDQDHFLNAKVEVSSTSCGVSLKGRNSREYLEAVLESAYTIPAMHVWSQEGSDCSFHTHRLPNRLLITPERHGSFEAVMGLNPIYKTACDGYLIFDHEEDCDE